MPCRATLVVLAVVACAPERAADEDSSGAVAVRPSKVLPAQVPPPDAQTVARSDAAVPTIPGHPACRVFHAKGWLMDCNLYVPGGVFLRTDDSVARSACQIAAGTWSSDGCPREHLLGTCRDTDFVLHYYPDPHERVTTAELRRICETPRLDGRHGTFALP